MTVKKSKGKSLKFSSKSSKKEKKNTNDNKGHSDGFIAVYELVKG